MSLGEARDPGAAEPRSGAPKASRHMIIARQRIPGGGTPLVSCSIMASTGVAELSCHGRRDGTSPVKRRDTPDPVSTVTMPIHGAEKHEHLRAHHSGTLRTSRSIMRPTRPAFFRPFGAKSAATKMRPRSASCAHAFEHVNRPGSTPGGSGGAGGRQRTPNTSR